MPMRETDPLLKPADVARRLGVDVETLNVWRCNKRYDLPYVKVGRLVRYRPRDVEAFIEARLRT